MEKILVDDSTCIGCGACIAIDSEHFDFNDEGKSSVISNENLKSNNLSNAIESCPVAAIVMKTVNAIVKKNKNVIVKIATVKTVIAIKNTRFLNLVFFYLVKLYFAFISS